MIKMCWSMQTVKKRVLMIFRWGGSSSGGPHLLTTGIACFQKNIIYNLINKRLMMLSSEQSRYCKLSSLRKISVCAFRKDQGKNASSPLC